MPIYEYVCSQCGSRIEIVQKVTDPLLKKCRSCGGALKKVLSAPGIQFKGNGWYITDYARKPSPQKEEKPKEKAKPGESGSPQTASDKPSSPSSKD